MWQQYIASPSSMLNNPYDSVAFRTWSLMWMPCCGWEPIRKPRDARDAATLQQEFRSFFPGMSQNYWIAKMVYIIYIMCIWYQKDNIFFQQISTHTLVSFRGFSCLFLQIPSCVPTCPESAYNDVQRLSSQKWPCLLVVFVVLVDTVEMLPCISLLSLFQLCYFQDSSLGELKPLPLASACSIASSLALHCH